MTAMYQLKGMRSLQVWDDVVAWTPCRARALFIIGATR
jgi:hypothetical protein